MSPNRSMNAVTASGRIREPLAVTNRSDAQAVAVERLAGQVDDPLEHHRHDGQAGGPVLVDQLERRLGVEPAAHHDGAAHGRARSRAGRSPRRGTSAPRRRSSRRPATGSARASRPATPAPPPERRAPLGVPVVPEVSSTVRPGSRGCAGRLAEVLVDQFVERVRAGRVRRVVAPGEHLDQAVDPLAGLGEQRRELLVVHHHAWRPPAPARRASCGPEKPVLSSSASAPMRVGGRQATRRGRGGCGTGSPSVPARLRRAARAAPTAGGVDCAGRARPRSASRARRPARRRRAAHRGRARCRSSRWCPGGG